MNFSYGIIAAVGILVAISIGFIAQSPDQIIEPRVMEEKPVACTMQWDPMCGVDGETYGNSCMLDAANVKLDYAGECVVTEPEPEPTPEPEPEPTPEPEPAPVETSPMPVATGIHQVDTAEGSGGPGCEETNECYIPYSITITVGDTVQWNNVDTAAHTVTSGSIQDGATGLFDSSLFMSGETFEFTFDEAGTYDYFCMVHPWMTGIVVVTDGTEMVVIEEPVEEPTVMEPEPLPEPTPEPEPQSDLPMSLTISAPEGSGVPGCEETNECYLPADATVAVGATVTWSNDDTAAHTVTSGNVNAGPTGVFDSGLFMSGTTFEFTFNEAGTFDYFCMVHPWMTGIIHVE